MYTSVPLLGTAVVVITVCSFIRARLPEYSPIIRSQIYFPILIPKNSKFEAFEGHIENIIGEQGRSVHGLYKFTLVLRWKKPLGICGNLAILKNYWLENSFMWFSGYFVNWVTQEHARMELDLRVAAVKSTESTWPLQVKSSHFSSKSPPKFFTEVAAEF